jgi:adenine-specific DNA-methyltransferase
MPPVHQIIDEIANLQGLARVPLFGSLRPEEAGHHEVLLDGKDGSFAVSVSDRADNWDASSWAWSANVPHHVSIVGEEVSVLRWDVPGPVLQLKRRDLVSFPEFYSSLRHDRVEDQRTIVNHSVNLFRSIRGILHHSGGSDDLAIDVYLALLNQLESNTSHTTGVRLPADSVSLLKSLPEGQIERALNDFSSVQLRQHTVNAWPSLAIRHASGAIFEEAHHTFVTTSPDLFGYVRPTSAIALKQSDVHFTPPAIARSIAEQAIRGLPNLYERRSLIVADYACGSGAFLIELLRALERSGYKGRVLVIGTDTSAIAVKTARFAVGYALAEWSDRAEYRIEIGDGLDAALGRRPKVDVIVMNPPFKAWQDLSAERRSIVESILGERVGRPDLSMAFISRALDRLRKDGVLATLLPASLLNAASAANWRKRLADRTSLILQASFDDHSIFPNATVRLGAMVLAPPSSKQESIELRAGDTPDASGDALRALRRLSVRGGIGEATGQDWVIRRLSPGQQNIVAARESKDAIASTVGDCFRLMQGIRTGCNPAFVLTESALQALPRSERRFFQTAITSQGIKNGRIENVVYVFYPYDAAGDSAFSSERQLRDRIPTYFSRNLLGHKEDLKARPRVTKWWELSEKRPGLRSSLVLFASKYFAQSGGIALNTTLDTSLVLQGFGWIPKGPLVERFASYDRQNPDELALSYLTVLNSAVFFNEVQKHSPPVQGGQRDMSPRFMHHVPLPLLDQILSESERQRLACYASAYYLGRPSLIIEPPTNDEVETLIERIVFRHQQPSQVSAGQQFPPWAHDMINAGLQEVEDIVRVNLLSQMQRLARSGDVSQIDAVLDQVDVHRLSQLSLVTLLRGTFAFRSRLHNWSNFCDRVNQEFDRRSIDRKKVLAGLLE